MALFAKKNRGTYLRIILTAALIGGGLVLLWAGISEYSKVKAILDLAAPDGDLEFFTPGIYAVMRPAWIVLGSIFVIIGGFTAFFPAKTICWISKIIQGGIYEGKALWQDAIDLRNSVRKPGLARWEWFLLFGLVIFAIGNRWVWIDKPMMHDESYTFIAFAKRPLIKIISDYHLPNNHILNTILIHFLYKLFGNFSPAVVRLPAFLAGVFCVPLSYFWSRSVYGRAVALLGSAWIAVLPQLITQSTNGRGYMLMAAFTLLMLGLGEMVRRRKNRAGWLLLGIVTVLNFYTLPIALYPFVILVFWLLVSVVLNDIGKEYASRWHFLKYLTGYGAVSGILVFLIHSPIFLIGTGWRSFFKNPFVAPLTWSEFRDTLPVRLGETLRDWTGGVPLWLLIPLAVGLLASMILPKRASGGKFPLQWSILIAIPLIFILQRPNPWSRIWTYLIPVILVFCAEGLTNLVGFLAGRRFGRVAVTWLTIVLIAAWMGFGLIQTIQAFHPDYHKPGQVETLTLWLGSRVTDQDIVLTSVDFGPAFWYYADLHHFPLEMFADLTDRMEWRGAYFVVDQRENDTYEKIISRQKLVRLEDCPAERVEEIHSYGSFVVFFCLR